MVQAAPEAVQVKRTPLKRGRRRKPAAVIERDLWRHDLGPCRVCYQLGLACSGPVQGHHVLTQQALRKRGFEEFLWDKRNRLATCEGAHMRHHTRIRPIPRELLPDSAFEFAAELGLTWLLERVYPEQVAA